MTPTQEALQTLANALKEILGEGSSPVRLQIDTQGRMTLVKTDRSGFVLHRRRLGADELDFHVRLARENKKHSIQCEADGHQIGRISMHGNREIGRTPSGPKPEFIQMRQNDPPWHPPIGQFLTHIDHAHIPGLVVMTVKRERECPWWKKSANRHWGVKGHVVRLVRQHGDRPPYAVIRYHDEDFDGCFDLWELRVC